MHFSNYWTSNAGLKKTLGIDKIPVLFKIQGTVSGDADRIAVFFDEGMPVFTNKYDKYISCSSSESKNIRSCRFYQADANLKNVH